MCTARLMHEGRRVDFWPDTGKSPVHGLLAYANQTHTINLHEFNADKQRISRSPSSSQSGGRVCCPGHIGDLLLDDRIVALLRDQIRIPPGYFRLLENRKHVDVLLKIMNTHLKLGQERAAELRRRLSWQEMADIWHAMDIPETETLHRESTHTEADLQALF